MRSLLRRIAATSARQPALFAAVLALPIALLAGAGVFWLFSPTPGSGPAVKQPDGPVKVTPVSAPPQTQAVCRTLLARLPGRLVGQSRPVRSGIAGDAAVPGDYAAAWSNPAIVLRCGVPRPSALTPTAQLIGVQGVEWVAKDSGTQDRPSEVVWTSTSLSVYVELSVPRRYRDITATQLLNPLAPYLLESLTHAAV